VTRTSPSALNVAPDLIPFPCLVNAIEDNTTTTAATTAMKEVDQEVVDMLGYNINTDMSSHYTVIYTPTLQH